MDPIDALADQLEEHEIEDDGGVALRGGAGF